MAAAGFSGKTHVLLFNVVTIALVGWGYLFELLSLVNAQRSYAFGDAPMTPAVNWYSELVCHCLNLVVIELHGL